MTTKDTYQVQHLRNLADLQKRVSGLYGATIEVISAKCRGLRSKGDKPFSFADFPDFAKEADILLHSLGEALEVAIVNGVRASWTLANNKDNEIGRAVLGERISVMDERQVKRYFNNREPALEAFLARKAGGLDLSDRVWKYTDQYRTEIELGLDIGLREGKSAQAIARDLKEYLQHPDKLFRRVRDERGMLHLSKNAAGFHPGNGVYRSSYKNALRLAVTEVNMAYHTADYERWRDMDFIVGIEVRLSGNHTVLGADGKYRKLEDICDELQGRYPKDFKFTGWHPNCRCQAIPIFKTDEELDRDLERELAGEGPIDAEESGNAVKELPENFTDWVEENTDRIERSTKRGTLPYFLRDNQEYRQFLNHEVLRDNTYVEQAAQKRHAARTPARIEFLTNWAKNHAEYSRLIKDPNYYDVTFHSESGGLKATHVGHNFDGNKGWYEKEVQRIGFENGNKVIFTQEDNTQFKKRQTEGTWNDLIMEIAGAENGESQNIRNALKHCASKKTTEVAVIFSLQDLTEAQIKRGFIRYNGLRDTTQWKKFKEIIVIFKSGQIKKYRPI